MTSNLIQPHTGKLNNLIVGIERQAELIEKSRDCKSWSLNDVQLCNLELLLNGAYSPLSGFMNKQDYESVCADKKLTDGTLWAIPVTFDISEEFANSLEQGEQIALRDAEGVMLAMLEVEDFWEPDLNLELQQVSRREPKDKERSKRTEEKIWYVGGKLEGVRLPIHYDFATYRLTPSDMRTEFARRGWRRVAAFFPRKPMHRAEVELTKSLSQNVEANFLLHAIADTTQPNERSYFTRIRSYEAVLKRYPSQTTRMALLPLTTRASREREIIHQALVGKNFGCTHIIVEAPQGIAESATAILKTHEIDVEVLRFQAPVYLEESDEYKSADELLEPGLGRRLSEYELKERFWAGKRIPDWYSFPEVIDELRRAYPPRSKQGFTVFFTGLSGSGKSTLANALMVKLMQMGDRPVTLLDGDIVRKNLSSELGFSKEHRAINIRRIGYVASEITKNAGVAVCAPIAPYNKTRLEVKNMIESLGGFILVHVSTPVEVCEKRDRKGLYAKARAGIIKEFTGISDPYEEPENADIILDTTDISPEEGVQRVLLHLEKRGYIVSDPE
ncbi:bifunctional sulfate adenylyltransferase/adenylylsulfate kinase [bacterium]|nr:bifunctional sulfate adenylyltransferase/adenylylsulfate kinase [bacterium]